MGKRGFRALTALIVSLAMFAAATGPGTAQAPTSPNDGDTPILVPGTPIPDQNDDLEAKLLQQDAQFVSTRTAGDVPLTIDQATALRKAAADQAKGLKQAPAPGPATFAGSWSALGPNPLVQVQRSDSAFTAESGRIGALLILPNGRLVLGAAQGGIWTSDNIGNTWTARTDNLASTATGALAYAPSDPSIVYDGTGEGALSGDSYFGNGILKSTDGGTTWSHVSGDFFVGVSTARLAVDPGNANHLYAAILRGRGGDRRVSPPIHSAFGIWESKDGGVNWTLLKAAPGTSLGATDIRLDPQKPTTLYSSFWGDAIYKSTDGGASWNQIMNGLPAGNFSAVPTRFSLGLSHPATDATATLYTGFDWVDATTGKHKASQIFKSTDEGANWVALPTGTAPFDTVLDYCSTQCFYDNVIEPDPTNPNIVFVAGSFGYNMPIPSGGVFRSDDGGTTWKNIGWDMHPDFHALAFDPNDSSKVLVGNDGGVWYSTSRGGRTAPETGPCMSKSCLNKTTWQDVNGTVNPATAGVIHRTGLQISQFTSIAVVPQMLVPVGAATQRFWGGTQDNGTLRKSVNSQTFFDQSSGDGGQVVIDQTDQNSCGFGACFVFGTFFGISLYRFQDGGAGFFTNAPITHGINTNERSEFYIPVALNQQNTSQLFTATFRLYRTDNAETPNPGDVQFNAISPDLTTGCTGAAPNGARACVISAIGIGGGTGAYVGTDDGLVWFSPNAMISSNPTWTRLDMHSNGSGDKHSLPNRPVAWVAVDKSNDRIAYLGYNGYNAATPHQPGHVFKTTDAGNSWTDISGNLPDNPVNSLSLDPSYPNTLYAATDVGPFVTYDGGAIWGPLGTGFPSVAVDQIDLDSYDRVIGAGTHGRGAFQLADTSGPVPALVLSKVDAGVPVGPGSNIDYTLTLRNIGNADATGVTITDPVPANTSFVSADSGGTNTSGTVTWSGLSAPVAGSVAVHYRVRIDPGLKAGVTSIVDDGMQATSAQGPSTTGSATVTPIAPAFALKVAPASQTDGARVGQSVTYPLALTNLGFKNDSYTMSSTGGTFPVSFFGADCTTPLTATSSVAPGATTNVCAKVAVPASAPDSSTSTANLTATSVGSSTATGSASIKTIAVAVNTLVVDDDSFVPSSSANVDVNKFYTDALTANGVQFQLWDLGSDKNLPLNYLKSFKDVVWFTGNSYPSPIGPYESRLKSFLDGGGNLFLSGQDLLDQSGGTTAFVHDYLHVTWDGSETQNDKLTKHVNGVAGTITAGVGSVPIDDTVLQNDFMDEITPNGTALTIFTDDATKTDGLSFSGTYKVVFLAFPMEEYGSAADRVTLVSDVFTFFGP